MTEHKACIVCNKKDLKAMSGYEVHNLVKCSNCSFVFIKKIPSQEELEEHYKIYAYSDGQYMSEVTKKRYNELLDEFESYRSTNRILDVGCGAANFLSVAKERGWEVYGTEFSEKAVEHGIKKGINVKRGVLSLEDFDKDSFDVITSFEVIEHIYNPQEEVQKFYNLLRKRGLLYCTTPNFNALARYYLKSDYNIIVYPEHLSYYTTHTLNGLFNKIGLRKKKIFTSGFSLNRFVVSNESKNQVKKTTVDNTDEKLRNSIESNLILRVVKKIVNAFLSVTSKGATIKAYYIK